MKKNLISWTLKFKNFSHSGFCIMRAYTAVMSLFTLPLFYSERFIQISALKNRKQLFSLIYSILTFCLILRHVKHFFKFPAFELSRVFLLLLRRSVGNSREGNFVLLWIYSNTAFVYLFVPSANGWKLKHFERMKSVYDFSFLCGCF